MVLAKILSIFLKSLKQNLRKRKQIMPLIR